MCHPVYLDVFSCSNCQLTEGDVRPITEMATLHGLCFFGKPKELLEKKKWRTRNRRCSDGDVGGDMQWRRHGTWTEDVHQNGFTTRALFLWQTEGHSREKEMTNQKPNDLSEVRETCGLGRRTWVRWWSRLSSFDAPGNHQTSTKNKYRSMSFAAIHLKILTMRNNYASYNMRTFWG